MFFRSLAASARRAASIAVQLCGLCLTSLALSGCDALSSNGPQGEGNAITGSADNGAPPIWEIRSSDEQVEGWLFGTVHALPDGFAWGSPELSTVITSADTLVVEVASVGDADSSVDAFAALAFDNPGPPLANRIKAAQRPVLEDLALGASVTRKQLDQMETWAAALALAQGVGGARAENGVDRALIARFSEEPIIELEGVFAQLSIFDALPEQDQRDLLNAVLSDGTSPADAYNRLIGAWQAGDLDDLEAQSLKGILSDAELYEALLANRNRSWTSKITNLLSAPERPLIAVGAGHMIGPDGLPQMLENAGYDVVRIQ
jgi:uncharacterized protein YbaP (TraB family)